MAMVARLAVMIVLALGGLWLAAEPLLVAQARRHVQAGAIGPQPGLARLGLSLADAAIPTRAGLLTLPTLDLWATPLAPATLRADLPGTAFLEGSAGRRQVGMEEARAVLAFFPLGAVRRADLSFAALSLEGAPLAGQGAVTAQAVADDRMAGHPFQVRIDLPDLQLPQVSSAAGEVRLWLDHRPGVATQTPPAVLGLATEGFEIGTGGFAVRLVGRLGRDADGLAQGRLALYSSDAAALLETAIEAGLMPPTVRLLAQAMLGQIARMEFADGGGDWPPMPPAPADQIRIPLEMRDGRTFLGAIDIGPAPAWPAP